MKVIARITFLIAIIGQGCTQKNDSTNHFTLSNDTLHIKTETHKGVGLFIQGAGSLRFEDTSKSFLEPDSLAISIKTVFHFDEHNIRGFLFLITSHESIDWLKKALHAFLAQFD